MGLAAAPGIIPEVSDQPVTPTRLQNAWKRLTGAAQRPGASTPDRLLSAPRPAGGVSPEQVVEAAYWLLLGREPDADAREQVRRLESGQDPDTVARALISSTEFRLRYFDLTDGASTPARLGSLEPRFEGLGGRHDFLAACYCAVLGREPDAEGLAWYAGLLDRGASRATAVWTMLTGDEFAARYRAICPAGGRVPSDVQLCELANPAKWDNPEWLRVLKELRLPAEHKLAMHRKAYEFTQTVWGLRRLGALTEETTVVSIGAGHEALLYWLANQVKFVLATDLYQGEWRSEGALEGDIRVLAQPDAFAPFPYRRDHLRFLQMDGTRLGVASERFDVAYSLSSIEHFGGFAGARRAVTEMARVVRPGGLVVVATECKVSGPRHAEVFEREEIHRLFDVPSLRLVQPIDDAVWRRYDATPIDLEHNPFETPHMLVRIGETVFTSVIVFLRKI